MGKSDKLFFGFIAAITLVVLTTPLFVAYLSWYRAGIQREVWQREGINLTQWEIFVGARPLERNIHIKSDETK